MAPEAPSLATLAVPFQTCGVTIGLPSSNRRTVSNAWKPQLRSFWLSLARASIDVVLRTTVMIRRLPAPPAGPRFGNSRAAVAAHIILSLIHISEPTRQAEISYAV